MPDSHLPLWQRWLHAWRPARTGVNTRERLRVALGAVFGIGLVVLACHPQATPAADAWPWIVAPMGASAVLVFGVPASPFAHPWSVLGADGVLAGIVTPADFTRDEAGGSHRRTQGTVADVMTRSVTAVTADTHLSELLPLLVRSGHHHIPIVDDARRLQGIVTQSDVVAALCRPT